MTEEDAEDEEGTTKEEEKYEEEEEEEEVICSCLEGTEEEEIAEEEEEVLFPLFVFAALGELFASGETTTEGSWQRERKKRRIAASSECRSGGG